MERKPLEVGKLYRTSEGKRCVCIWIESDGLPVGILVDHNGDLVREPIYYATKCGLIRPLETHKDSRDIIGEWIEPTKPLEFWKNIYRSDSVCEGQFTGDGQYETKEEAFSQVDIEDEREFYIRTALFREVIDEVAE